MADNMTDALYSLFTAVAGFLAVFGGWLAIQHFVRAHSGCHANKDTLEHLAHGCGGCRKGRVCSNRRQQEEHHEPTRI